MFVYFYIDKNWLCVKPFKWTRYTVDYSYLFLFPNFVRYLLCSLKGKSYQMVYWLFRIQKACMNEVENNVENVYEIRILSLFYVTIVNHTDWLAGYQSISFQTIGLCIKKIQN